ncbi:MAG: hypothetical protein NW205_00810 [Hyphomicrobiaceae bacterium]|nr:hypothetical protein [Hyphomicrobiaceae bacterium]
MTTTSFNQGLAFSPVSTGATRRAGRKPDFLGIFSALRDGLTAAHDYERLSARLASKSAAASAVFKTHYDR